MQIKGVDGLTPELLRGEIDRGGRLVIYTYCVSIVILTFKRPTAIYFVRAGQSPVTQGLPFALVTLLFGWWGFPWGPIYSIECLWKTLSGGIDVTNDIAASLQPKPGAADARGSLTTPPPALPPRPRRKPFSRRQVLVAASAILAGGTLIYAIVCDQIGRNRQVAVINGQPVRANYTLNGQAVSLPPFGYKLLSLPEGEFAFSSEQGLPAATIRVETPFWSRPFQSRVIVLNPDRAGLFYRYHVIYKGDRAVGDNHGQPTDTALYANEDHYILPAPDYAFEEPPVSITMPSSTSFASRTRLAMVPAREPSDRINVVSENLGPEAAASFARNLALARPDDEAVLRAVLNVLRPEDSLALLDSRIGDRPVRVEWHRAYQTMSERFRPDVDLRARYAAMAEASPEVGALRYLLARIETDTDAARRDYDLALAAPQPCVYAHLGLGYLDSVGLRYAAALSHFDLAIQGGIKNESVLSNRREMLLALRRHDELLADVRQRRAANPDAVVLAAEEIQCVLAASPDAAAARAIRDAYVSRAGVSFPKEELSSLRSYLDATIAYGLGDETAFAREVALLKGPLYAFQASVCRRDHVAARAALKDAPIIPSDYLLMLHLVALRAADATAAETYWNEALVALRKEGGSRSPVADQLATHAALDPESLRLASLSAVQKSLVFASLGLRHPERRELYHALAAETNFSPVFPHLLISSSISKSTAPTKTF